MIKSTKFLAFCLISILLILSSCAKKSEPKFEKTGTEGIVASFIIGQPPEKIYAEPNSDNRFDVSLEIRNKGFYPEPGKGDGINELSPRRFGNIFIAGYDEKIIRLVPKENGKDDLSQLALEGKSAINPNGGQDITSFTGIIDYSKLNVNIYEPILAVTACYYYETETGPSICIDPQPYSTTEKVCQVKDLSLSSQGAPIAVSRIDQETFATKTQFRITIKNVGNGEVAEPDQDKCSQQILEREQVDKVRLEFARASTVDLQCGPFIDNSVKSSSGIIRLINGEGSIICELSKDLYSNTVSAYTTPLSIRLSYTYRTHTQRKLIIVKES